MWAFRRKGEIGELDGGGGGRKSGVPGKGSLGKGKPVGVTLIGRLVGWLVLGAIVPGAGPGVPSRPLWKKKDGDWEEGGEKEKKGKAMAAGRVRGRACARNAPAHVVD